MITSWSFPKSRLAGQKRSKALKVLFIGRIKDLVEVITERAEKRLQVNLL